MNDALRAALARMSIFRNSTDAVLAFGRPELEILTLNPATEEMFGHHGSDLLGRPLSVLFGGEDGLPARVLDGEPHEVLGRRVDGAVVPLEIVVTEAEAGAASFYVACLRDIAERRRAHAALEESESRFRTAMDALAEGLVITNENDEIVYVNARMAQLAGHAPSEMVGRTFETLLVPDQERDVYHGRLELRLQGLTEQFDAELLRKDGSRFSAEVNATPFLGPVRGGVVVSAITDVSERKRIQEELIAAIDSSQDANRTKSAFLANMSHELRTPLNAIIGYSEMLQEELQERSLADLLPDLTKIHGAGRHLLRLINDILDISKIEAGKMELFFETFAVSELVKEVASTIQPLVLSRGNRLEVQCSDDVGQMRADLTRVRQILLNLLSNAAKFTENGTVSLDVERVKIEGVRCIAFRVGDTGIGMTSEQLGRIFEAFSQADLSTTRKYGGTGLGLTICRELTHKMGGQITVESEPGAGSTFIVRLPANLESDKDASSHGTLTLFPMSAPARERPVVLVADDDRLVRDLLKRFLTKQGFDPVLAGDGRAALALATERKPTLVLLDDSMPELDGWGVLQALKAAPDLAAIPVIMITIVDDQSRAYGLGAAEYLTKPIDWRRLGVAIAKHRAK